MVSVPLRARVEVALEYITIATICDSVADSAGEKSGLLVGTESPLFPLACPLRAEGKGKPTASAHTLRASR